MTCNCTGACHRPPYTCGGYGTIYQVPAGYLDALHVKPMESHEDWIDAWFHARDGEKLANPPASPTPFLLGLVVGCVLGGDFVWIIWQLFNGN